MSIGMVLVILAGAAFYCMEQAANKGHGDGARILWGVGALGCGAVGVAIACSPLNLGR